MGKRPQWLTPDTPVGLTCWRVFIPDTIECEAILRGILLDLGTAENWEQFGTATPQEMADAWEQANALTFEMTPCE